MSMRLATGGRVIDRTRPIEFTFDGRVMRGYEGDTVASALLANGQLLMGRSFKYHRPRSVVASGAEEPNALMTIGKGGRETPNVRATEQLLEEGLEVRSQNAWPSLGLDIGRINDFGARFLPAGFYYKTFIHPRPFWKHVFEPFIRKAAGLGPAPTRPDEDRYEFTYDFCDVLVVGGGIAGLIAARDAAADGARVMLVERGPHFGGRAVIDGDVIDGQPAEDWVKAVVQELAAMENVTLLTRCEGSGVYDHGYVLCDEAVSGPVRQRLRRVRAGHVIAATGALERPLSFAGNDLPGVLLASALRDYVVAHGVSVGDRTVIVTNNDDAYRTAKVLIEAGLRVPAILDARTEVDSPLVSEVKALGVDVHLGRALAKVLGPSHVSGVAVCLQAGEGAVMQEISCDCVAMSGGWSPVVHLWSHCGGKLFWDEERAMFRPDPNRPPTGADGKGFVTCVGAASGALTTAEVVASASNGTPPEVEPETTTPIAPVWIMPHGAGAKLRAKMWLDFQNDVKVSDVRLAAQEGFESVEHAKRYTTLGMATDQGKLSNINGLAVLSERLDTPIPQVGTTTFRPPYTPITLGALAGEAKGDLFQPLRQTPMHDWHVEAGAYMEPVGHWRRPYCYPKGRESHAQAVEREVKTVREALGMLDASTLGKLLVRGPDAGRFLDMLYTNMMSNLKPGRCRYGLMCDENGFLIDDGVVARIDEQTWLCHTTTGGADRIHAWMEDWLQCEWWDWKVHVVNLTEQFAQIAVVGPNARKVLEKLGGMDLSAEALPFMAWAEDELGGFPVRVFRISFSGELSYEIAVAAGQGRALWDRLMAEGQPFGMTPYGTEALHVLRAEKGFIMIGDETDGTVVPQDLGLDWAISKKKTDYLGKRGQMRPEFHKPDRWKLVGLETLDGSVLEEGAYAVARGTNANGQQNVEGRVTSTYYSPTLGRGIAMGLVARGPQRMGDILRFTRIGKEPQEARIVSPVFYDPEGEKQNV
ncbi:sarcosine oxidase subunit alpha family protein [Jannaschia seohaensis]|uniref:Sarcosine oxidase subunit alpha n=1 Tax=Jannaschia seohaensis TaxID=475081 RepID=A0A2Y9B5E2_9RHOB|nr:sarcosine oxidase subunit alpha family protein [Jannaschia seohaensis]PWJ15845.1 sarcosine oxidase subunit alpha [Jannaschia seohaensis]SSA49549.1 sarcosine oxidase subunit alpha [Jannaschia seohaensis]